MFEGDSDRGAGIINEVLHFSMDALRASAVAFSWIEWTDGQGMADDSVTAGTAVNFLKHYRENAAAVDPLCPAILASSGQQIRFLKDCRTGSRDATSLAKYESFLRFHGFGDEIDLVIWDENAPVAALGLFKKCGTSFGSGEVQWSAVQRFLQHHLAFHPRIAGRREARELQRRGGLTARELEVALRLRSGASNAAIADELGIGLATARTHVLNVLSKLGIQRRAQVGAMMSRWSE